MTYFDIAIIYLSLGAPLGVYSFFQVKSSMVRPVDVVRALGSVVFWPIYGVKLLFPNLRSVFANDGFARLSEADSAAFTKTRNVLSELKTALSIFPRSEAAESYAVVERYAELRLMLMASATQDCPNFYDLFAAAGHPNPRIGAKCLGRRNRQNVLKHQIAAHLSVIDLVESLSLDQGAVRKAIFDLGDILDTHSNRFGGNFAVFKGEEWKTIEAPSLENAMNTRS